ncbi:hybrid sensor histidine kinase/response regulator transcription factor [Mangrovibacterium diazotrophicum]|uniref:histidine kinase n=1 Tax=Mangrovibacterium diazotrophicum TaxID=1261403 RepID=A0A419W9A8_9BACT|nr:two-component regulator propeller domain-containing protein [Mangrovibacterium diazotrophicum]RKD92030.1 signal transduction histidine kinase [Mangrovibacterium diazotrophicum]
MNNPIKLIVLLVLAAHQLFGADNTQQDRYKFMQLSINDGLSNNQVKAILKDSQGFMWFGTGRGLNRFDGTNFKIYTHDSFDETTIPYNSVDFLFEDFDQCIWLKSINDYVIFDPGKDSFSSLPAYYKGSKIALANLRTITKDREKRTWFVNASKGLYYYDHQAERADSIPVGTDNFDLTKNDSFEAIAFDSKNQGWLVSRYFEIFKIDPERKQVLEKFSLFEEPPGENTSCNIFVDSDDDVWIWAPGQPYGAFQIKAKDGSVVHYTDGLSPLQLNANMVSSIVEEKNGLIWIASDHGGINVLDKKSGKTFSLVNNRDDRFSLCQNSVNTIYCDDEGIVWAGTFKKGISYYHPNLVQFEHYSYLPSVPNSLPYDDVNCFAEDNKGNLWIGTNGGGLIYFDRKAKSFKTYKNDPSDPQSLSSNVIVTLLFDRNNQLWVGSYFGGLDRFDGNVFHHHKHNPSDPTTISDNRVWEIFEDSRRNLWIGTLAGGLNLYDREKDAFYHYRYGDVNSVGADFITSVIEDSENNLWIGTSDGIDRFNLDTRRFYHFAAEPGVPGHLSDKNAIDLHEDSRGYLWIATMEGLNVFDKRSEQFLVFTEKDGLEDSNIKTLQEDQDGNLWVSTTHGLSKITVVQEGESHQVGDLKIQVVNYDVMDGLQGKEFNEKAAYRTKRGELIFGGGNGFNLFVPEEIQKLEPDNKLILTGLRVFNQEVKVGVPLRNRVILDQTLYRQKAITLQYNENVFSVRFAALNYFHPEKNMFRYRLEGFNQEWLNADPKNMEATFTNLNADDYYFQVQVSTDGTHWSSLEPPLKITVLPPFWKSTWAMIFYLILAIVILYFTRRFMLERQRLKFEAEQEHLEAQRIQQLDTLKTKFFTNISHEFRTPLTLIMSPLEKLINRTDDAKNRNQLIFIHRQSRRLLAMVNQLLDFRKMEFQKIEAKRSWGDLAAFISDLGISFHDMADNKQVDFNVSVNRPSFYTYFDQDKTYKIISNLLSNAFKFTPERGSIVVSATMEGESFLMNAKPHVWFQLEVQDSGIGIPEDKQTKIFDRFYQDDVPNSIVNQGSGIGLSMVNEYVSILDGTIKVNSVVGKGSTFTVRMPVQLFTAEEAEIINKEQDEREGMKFFAESAQPEVKDPAFDSSKRTILLVEDNDDFRFYLKDNLRENYNIFEAPNGQAGWEMCLKHLPDIVVSDVMMPVLTGTELCKKIKGDGRTSHLPVILLTAKVEAEDKLEGLESGADDYISKPFDFRILESRIENLINSREQLRQTYQTMIGINPEKIEVTSLDEKFIKKALEVVEKNISNSDFSVEDLAQEVGMSRVSLYKKLLSLTKKSPVEFIRIIRLKRAADLLENSQLSVSEVAYQVGFNSPRYFTRYFKEYYKELPSEYIAKHRRIENDFKDDF